MFFELFHESVFLWRVRDGEIVLDLVPDMLCSGTLGVCGNMTVCFRALRCARSSGGMGRMSEPRDVQMAALGVDGTQAEDCFGVRME